MGCLIVQLRIQLRIPFRWAAPIADEWAPLRGWVVIFERIKYVSAALNVLDPLEKCLRYGRLS